MKLLLRRKKNLTWNMLFVGRRTPQGNKRQDIAALLWFRPFFSCNHNSRHTHYVFVIINMKLWSCDNKCIGPWGGGRVITLEMTSCDDHLAIRCWRLTLLFTFIVCVWVMSSWVLVWIGFETRLKHMKVNHSGDASIGSIKLKIQ